MLFTTPTALSETGQGMREGTKGLRHTVRYEESRMLPSHNRKSLGREWCPPAERTSAADAALTVTVTCKITFSKCSPQQGKTACKQLIIPFGVPLTNSWSCWAHPIVWLRKSTRVTSHMKDVLLGYQILPLETHWHQQRLQANSQTQNLSYVPHSTTQSLLREKWFLPM